KWATDNAKDTRVNGIYVLICKDAKIDLKRRVEVSVGEETIKKAFTVADRDALVEFILAKLRKGQNDEALTGGVAQVRQTLSTNLGRSSPASNVSPTSNEPTSFWSSVGGIICIALVVILVIWLIVG